MVACSDIHVIDFLLCSVYCPFCGVRLEHKPNFCSFCGGDVQFLKEVKCAQPASTDGGPGPSHSSGGTLMSSVVQSIPKCREVKQEKSFFNCRHTKCTKKTARIQVGIMIKTNHGFKPVRGKTVPLNVETDWTSDKLLPAATRTLMNFNQIMEDEEFVLLYPDGTMVKNIPGTEMCFTVERYKEAIGKAYQRITLYICPLSSFINKREDDIVFKEEKDEVLVEMATSTPSDASFWEKPERCSPRIGDWSATASQSSHQDTKAQNKKIVNSSQPVTPSSSHNVNSGACAPISGDCHSESQQIPEITQNEG